MPSGKVKWFDETKGFGFVSDDEGGADVFLPKSSLPQGMTAFKPGEQLEYGVADGRKGPQALSVRVLVAAPSLVEASRREPEELHGLVDDVMKFLEMKVQPDLRRGKRPQKDMGKRAALILRKVADELDA